MRLTIKKRNRPVIKWTGDPRRHFIFKVDIQMASRHMKRCSAPLIIWEMEINGTVRHHITSIRMAITERLQSPLKRIWIKGNLWTLLVRIYIYIRAVTVENSIEVPQKVRNRTTISSHNSTLVYFSKEHNRLQDLYKNIYDLMFFVAYFIITKIKKIIYIHMIVSVSDRFICIIF